MGQGDMNIDLSPIEQELARTVASARWNLHIGNKLREGSTEEIHLDACGAELAVAKHLGQYWHVDLESLKIKDFPDVLPCGGGLPSIQVDRLDHGEGREAGAIPVWTKQRLPLFLCSPTRP
jgi:hypothetical protein